MTTKLYAPIEDVVASGQEPPRHVYSIALVDTLHVAAALGPVDYPERITITHEDLGSLALTSEQSAALRDRLEQAEADVDAALDTPPVDGGAMVVAGRCECCGRTMPIGTHVATSWDDDRGQLVMHWGPCPESAMWCVEYRYRRSLRGDGPSHRTLGMSREEAWIEASRIKNNPAATGIRILLLPSTEVAHG